MLRVVLFALIQYLCTTAIFEPLTWYSHMRALQVRLEAFHVAYSAAIAAGEFEFWADATGAKDLDSRPTRLNGTAGDRAFVGAVSLAGVESTGTERTPAPRFVRLLASARPFIAPPLVATLPASLPEPLECFERRTHYWRLLRDRV